MLTMLPKGGVGMQFCTCHVCGAELEVHENDRYPGCREMEEACCPICKTEVTKVFTSGIPNVTVIKRGSKSQHQEK